MTTIIRQPTKWFLIRRFGADQAAAMMMSGAIAAIAGIVRAFYICRVEETASNGLELATILLGPFRWSINYARF